MRLSPQARCTLPMGSREAGTDGSWTHRWSETDSNPRSLSEGTCLKGRTDSLDDWVPLQGHGGSNPSRSKTLDPRSRDASSQNSSATEKTRLRRPRPCGLVQLLSSSPHRKPEMRKMCLLGDLRVQISLEQITRSRIFAMTRHGAASRSLLPCRIWGGNQIRVGAGEVKMCRSQGV